MKICLINWIYKFNTINNLIILKNQCKKINIDIDFFITSEFFFNSMLKTFIDSHQKYKIEVEFLNQIKLLTDIEELKKYNKIIISEDFKFNRKILDNNRINFHKEVKNIFSYKFRICNDIYESPLIKKEQWLPSEVFKYNSLNYKQDNCDYVQPLEVNKKNIYENNDNFYLDKYQISKPLIIYQDTIMKPKYHNRLNEHYTDNLLRNKIITNKEINNKFHILISGNPYETKEYISTYIESKNIIDPIDLDYLLNKFCKCLISGISTSIRESLLLEIPVIRPKNIKISNKNYDDILRNRFDNKIQSTDEFEGKFININDNLIDNINFCINKKFNFNTKKNIWFDKKDLFSKIKEICEY